MTVYLWFINNISPSHVNLFLTYFQRVALSEMVLSDLSLCAMNLLSTLSKCTVRTVIQMSKHNVTFS